MSPRTFEVIDSATSYLLAMFLMLFGALIDNASIIMTLGGMALLGLRLYVDGVKARQTYNEHKEWKDDRQSRN